MPKPSKEDIAKGREAAAALCRAYRQVLGRDGARTPAQELVWRDMERRGYRYRSTMVKNEAGQVDGLLIAQAEGCRIYHLQTEEFIARAEGAGEVSTPTQARKE